jgi:hypothetical protein
MCRSRRRFLNPGGGFLLPSERSAGPWCHRTCRAGKLLTSTATRHSRRALTIQRHDGPQFGSGEAERNINLRWRHSRMAAPALPIRLIAVAANTVASDVAGMGGALQGTGKPAARGATFILSRCQYRHSTQNFHPQPEHRRSACQPSRKPNRATPSMLANFDDLEMVAWETLARIHRRGGVKISTKP